MDGARLSNAAATTQCTLKQMTTDAGVDILSFGGTKNGLMGAEAVVILNPQLQKQFEYIRKQGLHLASKMRYLSAQWIAYFKNDLWRENAQQANAMAQFLCSEMQQHCPQYTISHPVQANSVFCCLPKSMILKLQEQFAFYVWNESLSNDQSEVRWMCSFNTQQDEVIQLVQSVKRLSESV
jgi:threonine aldolase